MRVVLWSLSFALLVGSFASPKSFAQGLRKQSPQPAGLQSPARIAVDGMGNLLVSDRWQKAIFTVSQNGRKVRKLFDVDGRPEAIGWLDTRIFVGNTAEQRMEVYSLQGTLLGVLGGAGTVVAGPTDLAIDAGLNRLFVVDKLAKDVKVFDISTQLGTSLGTIGAVGLTPQEFQFPTGITIDPISQELYVSDFGDLDVLDPRIMIFRYDGTFQAFIGSDSGGGQSYFFRPQGLALGATGHVFVTDSWFGQVRVMDRASGALVGTIGAYGEGPGEMRLPLDLVIHGAGNDVFVTNNRLRRIEAYAQGGNL